MFSSFQREVQRARQQDGLPMACLLGERTILDALGTASALWQSWIYTPAVTVWVLLSQCPSSDHSCREAVSRLIAWRVARGQEACSADTSA